MSNFTHNYHPESMIDNVDFDYPEDYIDEAIYELQQANKNVVEIKTYKSSKHYIQVSESYLIRNWDRIEKMKKIKTMLVIQSVRRVKDIKWLIKNQSKFQYDTLKMYNIILLKDKLMFNYSESSSNLSNS